MRPHQVIAKLQLKLKKCKQATSGRTMYNAARLIDKRTTQTFLLVLCNRYQLLPNTSEEKITVLAKRLKRCGPRYVKKR